jgi:eukaryotic-like serine/threonine-protein kinase
MGEALLERLGPGHDRVAGWLANNRAGVELGRGEYAKALAHAQAALSLKLKVLPSDHPDVAITWTAIVNAQTALGRHDAALEAAEKTVEIFRRAYGPENPIMWHPLGLRGEVLSLLGRRREAEVDLRAAIELSTAWMGAEHHWNAYPMTALGKTLTAAGRPAGAIPLLRTALRIRERSDPHTDLVAETRFALASALWAAGGQRDAARAMAATARDAYRSQPAGAKPAAEIDAWLASHAAD